MITLGIGAVALDAGRLFAPHGAVARRSDIDDEPHGQRRDDEPGRGRGADDPLWRLTSSVSCFHAPAFSALVAKPF